MAAFELEDLQAITLRLAQLLDLTAVAVLGAHGQGDRGNLHAAEALDAVVELASAGALQDHAAETVADAGEDRARACASGKAGTHLAAGGDAEAFLGVLIRGEEVTDAGVPRAVLGFVEEDGDVTVLLDPVGHVAHRGVAARRSDEDRGPALGRVTVIALRQDDAVMVDAGVFRVAAVVVAGDARLDAFLDDEALGGRPRGDRIGGTDESGEQTEEQGGVPAHDEGVGMNRAEGKRGCGLEACPGCSIA